MIDEGMDVDEMLEMIQSGFAKSHEVQKKSLAENMRTFEKAVMLRALDHHWKEHLAVMDQLRQSVNLRGMAKKTLFKNISESLSKCLLSFLKQ